MIRTALAGVTKSAIEVSRVLQVSMRQNAYNDAHASTNVTERPAKMLRHDPEGLRTMRGVCVLFLVSLACATCGAVRLTVQDPDASLAEIRAWHQAAVKEAHETYKPAALQKRLQAIQAEYREKAKSAVQMSDPANTEPAKCHALAQLYWAAGLYEKMSAAVERFLTTNPSREQQYYALFLKLEWLRMPQPPEWVRDRAGELTRTIGAMEPPHMRAAVANANAAARTDAQIALKYSLVAALSVLDRTAYFLTPQGMRLENLPEPERAQAENAFVEVELARTKMLMKENKVNEAVQAREEAMRKIRVLSPALKRYNLYWRVLSLPGQPAPDIVRQRGYGNFAGIKALKGKVVVLEFCAHWSQLSKQAAPAMIRMYSEWKGRGLQIGSVTGYYGFYGAQRPVTRDQEFAKLAEYVGNLNLPWPLVVGPPSNFDSYGVTAVPAYVVIDRQGLVYSVTSGYSAQLHSELRANVEKCLSAGTDSSGS